MCADRAPPSSDPPKNLRSVRFSRNAEKQESLTAIRRSSSMSKNAPRQSVGHMDAMTLSPEVWVFDEESGIWVLHKTVQQDKSVVLLKNLTTSKVSRFDLSFVDVHCHDTNIVADMTALHSMSEPTILYNLEQRSKGKNPYTYMGTVLISCNPFEWYAFPETNEFAGKALDPNQPHPYAIAELAYQQVCLANASDQAVVISGESGAGKTESAKMVMSYIVGSASSAGSSGDNIEERLLQSSPILEAFGNAKTFRNANSSRFGKYMKMFFSPTEGSAADSDGSRHRRIVSASVETYLLEKSRVSGQSDGEENFHIFYIFLAAKAAGATPSMEGINTTSDSNAQYMFLGGCRRMDVSQESLVQQFHAVETSMRTLGYSEAKISSSWAVIAAILELGNVKFVDIDTSEGTAASIPDQTHCILAANLLGVNLDSLVNMLTKRTMKTTKEVYTISLNALDADHARNAFCKALYANMFADIVDSINSSLGGNDSSVATGRNSVGVLDIFGFESFDRNELQQLLINYANEVLQDTFNEKVFQNELRLFQEENIKTSLSIEECPSNTACVGLIYARSGPSIVSILHNTAEHPNSSDENFCETLHKTFGGSQLDTDSKRYFSNVHPKDRKSLFAVKHFAGEVIYTVGEKGHNLWLNKNHDKIPEDMCTLVTSSSNAFVSTLSGASASLPSKKGCVAGSVGTFSRKATVSDRFISSMAELCDTLSSSQCSFIRCIKPNAAGRPQEFDRDFVINQIRALGLVQVCEVMKVGLPTRITFSELRQVHSLRSVVMEATQLFVGEPDEILMASVLWALGVPDTSYELGLTRVFFRAGQLNSLERILTTNFQSDMTAIKGRLEEAHRVRTSAKAIVDSLNDELKSLDDGFVRNRAEIEALDSAMHVVVDTDVWAGSSRADVSNVSSVLSLAQVCIHDVEVNVLDLAEKGIAVYAPVKALLDNANGILNDAELIWRDIDEKYAAIDAFECTNAVEVASAQASRASEELECAASLMNDVKHMVYKTVLEANRCQLTTFQRRAEDCKHNITVMTERLAANLSDLVMAASEVKRVQQELDDLKAVVRDIQGLCERAFAMGPRINEVCDAAREEANKTRLKMATDEKDRERLQVEARAREARERAEREAKEREASLQQDAAMMEKKKELRDVDIDDLPHGWEVELDASRNAYYYINELTGATQWTRPTVPAASTLAAEDDMRIYDGEDVDAPPLPSPGGMTADSSIGSAGVASKKKKNAHVRGILLKQGKYFGSWRKLYFVLNRDTLEHYPSVQSYLSGAPPTKMIRMTTQSTVSYSKFKLCFEIATGGRTTWMMMAEDEHSFKKWMRNLCRVVVKT